MTDMQEQTSSNQEILAEVTEIILELEEYRERLENETLSIAQRAKIKKADAMANLQPQLDQIDAQLQVLYQHKAKLTDDNDITILSEM